MWAATKSNGNNIFCLGESLDSPEHACYQGFSALIELESSLVPGVKGLDFFSGE